MLKWGKLVREADVVQQNRFTGELEYFLNKCSWKTDFGLSSNARKRFKISILKNLDDVYQIVSFS